MKILLTGVAGFIGWKTAERLMLQGDEVIGIDNLNDYYSPHLKKWRLEQLKLIHSGKFQFNEVSIEDRASLNNVFKKQLPDAVINLAARAGVRASIDDPWIYQNTNITGTLNLLDCMREFGVKKFVLSSSSSLYAGQNPPFVETQTVDRPLSPYAASKKAAEVLAYSYHHLYQIDVSILRYFTVYGPAGRPDMSPLKFCHCIANELPIPLFGNGKQSRDFTYIDDIADGTIAALAPQGYEVYNLGGGLSPISILEMINEISKTLGKEPIIEFLAANEADMSVTVANNDKARNQLGWSPKISPEEGFKHLVRWYLENKELMNLVYQSK